MNFSRAKRPADVEGFGDEPALQTSNDNAKGSHPAAGKGYASERKTARLERDAARGYSINVKQVVLAFAVEFWIIGLIIVGTYLLIAESDPDHVSREAVFSALLLPAALAMVELARVPLALAARTQDAWHIKLLATLGVLAAITVTSFSSSQIAWKTFDIRIAEATRAGDRLAQANTRKETFESRSAQLQQDVDQKVLVQKGVSDRPSGLELQLTKITSSAGMTCRTVIGQDGAPAFTNGKPIQNCTPTTSVNPAQLKAIKDQMAITEKELDVAKVSVKQAENEKKKNDPQQIEQDLENARADYRAAVGKSQLHSYAAMITGKSVAEVSDSDVKNLEKYLILIPSIAAAFASTLIAITAVRRIRPDRAVPSIPDDAAAYLFGPLLAAIKTEARATVTDAMNGRNKAGPHPAEG